MFGGIDELLFDVGYHFKLVHDRFENRQKFGESSGCFFGVGRSDSDGDVVHVPPNDIP